MIYLFAILALIQPPVVGVMAFKRAALHPTLSPFKFSIAAIVMLVFYGFWYAIYSSLWAGGGAAS